jgi:hypothetical protein
MMCGASQTKQTQTARGCIDKDNGMGESVDRIRLADAKAVSLGRSRTWRYNRRAGGIAGFHLTELNLRDELFLARQGFLKGQTLKQDIEMFTGSIVTLESREKNAQIFAF